MHATARVIYDALLHDHRLARAQNILYAHHIGDDGRVNWLDDDWDDLCDKPADEQFLCKNSVGSVSSRLWIATWIAFWIASGHNQFFGIIYCINMFVEIICYCINLFDRILYLVNLFGGIVS